MKDITFSSIFQLFQPPTSDHNLEQQNHLMANHPTNDIDFVWLKEEAFYAWYCEFCASIHWLLWLRL